MRKYQNTCGCTDRYGQPKNLYRDSWDAEDQISFARQERGVLLKKYSCPAGFGYHLTSSQ